MLKRILIRILQMVMIVVISALAMIFLPRLFTAFYANQRIHGAAEAPVQRAAIVFGAGLWRDGTPSTVLRDRIATAADLYFAGKVEKLLMSGDNRFEYYNEPAAMRDYAMRLGIPEEDIVLDYAGRRTYDTCYRAREIFGLQHAILVTQRFHLPRAIYTCNALGVDALGVPADRRDYHRFALTFWHIRELGATMAALWDVHIAKPLPVLGESEPIFPGHAQ